MKTYLFLLLIVLPGCTQECPAQAVLLPKGYKNWYIGNFRCGVFVPPSYNPSKKYPLVVYLHGHTDTTSRNFGWYHEPSALADPAIVLTPKCPASEDGRWGDTSSKELSPMMKKTFEMMDVIKKKYNIDENRLYIHGTSMGAIGTFAVIQKYPNMFAGGYAICGWASPGMAPQLSQVPFWIFHGEKDDIVPVEGSRGIYHAVVANGGKQIRYTEFKDVKHNAWNYVNNNKVYAWLLAQRKGAVHGLPDKLKNVRGKVDEFSYVFLEWEKPDHNLKPDNNSWYYKIYRNNNVIAEVDSDKLNYTDNLVNEHTDYEYKVSVVNYYFKESDLSEAVRVKTGKK